MYCYKLVEGPLQECGAGCGTVVTDRLAGHFFSTPMCRACFDQAAPELVAALSTLQPDTCVRNLAPSSAAACANCGSPLPAGIAGHHAGDPLCPPCFEEHAPRLASLLFLDEAVLQAAVAHDYLDQLLTVALAYLRISRNFGDERPPLIQDSWEEPDDSLEESDQVSEPVETSPPRTPSKKEPS